MKLYNGFLESAEDLLDVANFTKHSLETKEATYRNVISRIYYGIFHYACQIVADSVVGKLSENPRLKNAWVEVYRGVEHGSLKDACNEIAKDRTYTDEIKYFAEKVVDAQNLRHRADYDPTFSPSKNEAWMLLLDLSQIISNLSSQLHHALMPKQSKVEEVKRLAVRILVNSKGTQIARRQVREAQEAERKQAQTLENQKKRKTPQK